MCILYIYITQPSPAASNEFTLVAREGRRAIIRHRKEIRNMGPESKSANVAVFPERVREDAVSSRRTPEDARSPGCHEVGLESYFVFDHRWSERGRRIVKIDLQIGVR